MNNIMEQYNKAEECLFNHVGFISDWVVYPIDDETDKYWSEDGEEVKYAESIDDYNSDGNYFVDEIYKQRFYKKWVYRGKKLTLIFCDPHVDGVRWFRIFDNEKEIKK